MAVSHIPPSDVKGAHFFVKKDSAEQNLGGDMNTMEIENLAKKAGLTLYGKDPKNGLLSRAKVDSTVFSRLKAGDRKFPQLETVLKLAVTLADALGEDRGEVLARITDVKKFEVVA